MPGRIAVIGSVGVPSRYGGFETLVEQLVRHLSAPDRFTVYCSRNAYSTRPPTFHGAKLVYLPLRANGIQSVGYDTLSILHAVRRHGILLVLGVSGGVVLPFARWLFRRRVIVHLDGLEWRRQKWGRLARWFLKLSERLAVWAANAIVTDNEVIREYVATEYGRRGALIAYGGDHVQEEPSEDRSAPPEDNLPARYALSVCRIEPENNIHMILEAFGTLREPELVVVGNWSASKYGRDLRTEYSRVPHIHCLDPIYDPVRLNGLRRRCTVYVHGHSCGGTNPSLVEAMSLRLPVFAFDVPYNRSTTDGLALYFQGADSLRDLVFNVPVATLQRVATDLERVARERYTWAGVAEDYAALLGNRSSASRVPAAASRMDSVQARTVGQSAQN